MGIRKTLTSITEFKKLFGDTLGEFPFVFADVGAKGTCKPRWKALVPHLRRLAFEPDTRSRIELESWTTLFRTGLSNTKGTSTLYLTRQRSLSSLLRPNEDWASRIPASDRAEIVGTETVEVDLLDNQVQTSEFEYVDFLDLNTQGSEFWILQGAERTVRDSVLGFEVEINYAPRYHDQPGIGEIDLFARNHGFDLFDFTRNYAKRKVGRQLGGRHGQVAYGHALYLSSGARLAGLLESSSSPEERKARLVRAIMILVLFGYCDCALETVYAWKHELTDAELNATIAILHANVELRTRLPNFPGRGRLATLFRHVAEFLEPHHRRGNAKDWKFGNLPKF